MDWALCAIGLSEIARQLLSAQLSGLHCKHRKGEGVKVCSSPPRAAFAKNTNR